MTKYITTAAAAFVLCTQGAFASGSSPMRPQLPPQSRSAEAIDSAKYELGKAVFNGKAPLSAPNAASARAQKPRLAAAAANAGKSGANLPALAGRLSESQLSAVEYFISKRH